MYDNLNSCLCRLVIGEHCCIFIPGLMNGLSSLLQDLHESEIEMIYRESANLLFLFQ